jgi:hypothetical protein
VYKQESSFNIFWCYSWDCQCNTKKITSFTAGMGNVDRTSIGSLAGIDVKMFVGFVAGSVSVFSMGAAIGFDIGTSIATK